MGLLRRLVLDFFAGGRSSLLEGHGSHTTLAGGAAHWSLRPAARVLRERRHLLQEERTPDLTGMYHRSVAYDRFILGWKRFDKLDVKAFERPSLIPVVDGHPVAVQTEAHEGSCANAAQQRGGGRSRATTGC